MLTTVAVTVLVAGSLLLIAGLALLGSEWKVERDLRQTVRKTNREMQKSPDERDADSPIEAQGGVDSAVNSVANLAKAIKDLNSSSRLLVLALAFYAIAAATVLANVVTTP